MGKKIEFTSEQFFQLMRLVYLGRWMTTSHHEEPDQSVEDLEQYIYAHAKDYGLGDFVDFDPKENKFLPVAELDEEMEPIIQEYDDFSFWDQLAWQLAERDFSNKFDHSKILCMTADEIFREKNAIADKYFDEFSESGLNKFSFNK
jgi:hypothetical protein